MAQPKPPPWWMIFFQFLPLIPVVIGAYFDQQASKPVAVVVQSEEGVGNLSVSLHAFDEDQSKT
jgi:hypothetical protein